MCQDGPDPWCGGYGARWDTPPVPPDVTSAANDRIKWLIRLRDRKHRDAEGVFVVEGRRLYERALSVGLEPRATFSADPDGGLAGEVVTTAPEVLDKASYRERSEGLIAVFDQFQTGLDRLEVSSTPLLLIVEGIEKPGNLGAMMRTAAAAGVDGVITVGGSVDVFNPNALRASTGAVFSVSLAVSSWDDVVPWLAERRIRPVGASPDAPAQMWDADLSGPLALVIGAEDRGLTDRAQTAVDELVVIPQVGSGVDSLNASVAAAVLLFEAVRQRRP